jgi:SAM-dependent methyltransferase
MPPSFETLEPRKCKNRFDEFINFLNNWESKSYDKKCLDAGAGPQRYKKVFKKNKYISQDFGVYKGGGNVLYYNQSKELIWPGSQCDIISDITSIPLKDSAMDLIICTEVLEHLYNPDGALREFSRILKDGGELAITMPYGCHYHQEPYFYNSGLSYYFFYEFSKKNNFEIIDCALEGDFRSFMSWENRILGLTQTNKAIRVIYSIWGQLARLFYGVTAILPTKQPKYHTGIYFLARKKALVD